MNRLGWLLFALFAAVAIGFAVTVRGGGGSDGAVADDAPAAPGGQPRAVAGPSGLVIPVAGVPASALVDTFGQDRGDGTRMHGALDIPAPRGAIVMAAAPGRVEKLFESEDGGHTIYIRSDDGRWIHYYAHLDTVLPTIAQGTHVDRAQAIATVGSTGNADPAAPHLHYEVKQMAPGEAWHQGQAIDPYPLLAGR
jgi:murein DD-endopeptidase MepM/ murein hydrolase activator NlpD